MKVFLTILSSFRYIIIVILFCICCVTNEVIADEPTKEEKSSVMQITAQNDTELLPEPYVDGRRIKFTTYEEDYLRITLRQLGKSQRITAHEGLLIDGDHEIILDWSRFRPGFYIIEIHSSKYLVRKQIRLI